ncbi:MAG: HDOD domain-containing protein [Proteobacteria bacterium]|nr:HDOD domain-containing protein [Pseudomonadota bacterium]
MQQALSNTSLLIEQEKLPSLPQSLLKLLEQVRDPDASFMHIAQTIQTDPALTSRFMAAANTGENYQLSKNKDFNSMVVSLGLKTVKSIACTSAVQQFFSQFNIDENDALAQFWTRSLNTAFLAKSLAHLVSYENEDEVYIAGLLHNIGELVCLVHDTKVYGQRSKKIMASKKDLRDKEVQLSTMESNFVGASIPEIGAAIIQEFDSVLSDAVLYQREGSEQLVGSSHLVKLINAAHKLSLLHKESDAESIEYVYSEVSATFDLGQSFLEEIRLKSFSQVLAKAKQMGLTIHDDQTVSIDESVQLDLADNVRTIALSNSIQKITSPQFDNNSELELVKKIVQNLKILFGLSHCVYLAFDEESKQLKVQYGAHLDEQRLGEFHIPLQAVSSLPIKSLVKQVPMASEIMDSGTMLPERKGEGSHPSVVDRQLARLLKMEEILCIPLLERMEDPLDRTDSDIYGVLVVGFSALQKQKIKREKGLLYEFSLSSSEVITQNRNTAKQISSVVEEDKALQSVQIRKLVHEVNNPLGVIRNYLQVLAHKLEDTTDEKIPGQLDILMQEVERVGSIVLRMRETPEKSSHDNHQVNINQLIENMGTIFKESLFLKAGIIAKLQLDSAIPVIESNTNSLKQIVTNLFKNASEAMPEGGEIVISTRDQVNFNGQQYIELSIADNGPGIPTEVLNNLFNPVKTTKSGEHSGLGLSIIRNLVNDLGGIISGSNSSNKGGAVFNILLPRKTISE